jgi:hypothetical protein
MKGILNFEKTFSRTQDLTGYLKNIWLLRFMHAQSKVEAIPEVASTRYRT